MTQTITTDSNCGFLTFLNDEKEDKIYPPLRMYKDKHFLFVDGKDQQQISVSRNNFEVNIDGLLYTDLPTAEAVLNIAVECVNDASGGGLLDPDAARKTQQLIQITLAEEANVELELINENLREKGDIGISTYFFDITAPNVGAFSFPKDLNQMDVTLAPSEIVSFSDLIVNNVDEFILLWNSLMSSVVLSKKSNSEVWVNDGTKTVADMVAGGPGSGILLHFNAALSYYQSDTWTTALKPTKEDPLSNVDFIEVAVNELVEKTEIRPLLPSTLDPVTISGNVAEVALLANSNRKAATIYVTGADLWLRQMPAANEPSNRKGIRPIENGASYDLSPNADNGFYLGEYSVINVADGETPIFYVTESI